MIEYLRSHGIDQATAEKYELGLVVNPAPDDKQFKGMLAIPYRTRGGVVALKFRCIVDHDCHTIDYHEKYAQLLEQKTRLYNPQAFFDSDGTIGIAEGEIDAIVATEAVGIPTLGIPGVESWTRNSKIWKIALRDYDTILVFADGDPQGLTSARRIMGDLGKRARMVRCETGQDVASTVAHGFAKVLRDKAGL